MSDLGTLKVGDKEYKILDTVKVIEIIVHKLENGQEISQVIAQEFMMTEHKKYLVRLLTKSIDTVMEAKKRDPIIKLASEVVLNKLRRLTNFNKKGAFGATR